MKPVTSGGWSRDTTASKAHLYIDGRPICGQGNGVIVPLDPTSKDVQKCKTCVRRSGWAAESAPKDTQ